MQLALYPPDGYPEWMPNVTKYEKIDDVDGKPAYRETNEYGVITYLFDVRRPGEALVVETRPPPPLSNFPGSARRLRSDQGGRSSQEHRRTGVAHRGSPAAVGQGPLY